MKTLAIFILLCAFALPVVAQPEDAEGCKDHALLNRLPNFTLTQCTENYASLDVVIAAEKMVPHEGTRTHLRYNFNYEGQKKPPSWLQIMKNHENALTKIGGKKIFSNESQASYKLSKDGKDIYVMVQLNSGEELAVDEYWLDVLEKEAMKQDITANDIYSALNTAGSIALYINFETGKSTIQPESLPTIDQVAEMLKTNATLNVSIEGHTDNTGTPAGNKTLSENRAKAVMNALISKGIAANRMSAKGWGQEKPIADNSTAEEKAKNRRVEIVKK